MAFTNGSARRAEDIFLFVNPKSGGNRGEAFLQVPQPFYVDCDDGRRVSLRIYSLLEGKPGAKCGYHELKKVVDKSSTPVKVIVGGGDGTVMWADTEATLHGIDSARQIIFGIVPLGTGNDFARVAGWGGKNPKKIAQEGHAELIGLVRDWAVADVRPHDVWKVEIDVQLNTGDILAVNSEKVEASLGKTELTGHMINYFSIGQESKVGIDFDKHRTKSQTCNLFVYAFEGAYNEIQCGTQQHVGNLVAGLYDGTDSSGRVIMDSRREGDQMPELVGNPESIMFLNVNSYAGGNAQFWQPTTEYGVKPRPAKAEVDVSSNPGDGSLEVLTLPTITNIPLDKLSHCARRVYSGGPSFYLDFFEAEDEAVDVVDAYCEIDGEFYHLVNPTSVKITNVKRLQVLQKAGHPLEGEARAAASGDEDSE